MKKAGSTLEEDSLLDPWNTLLWGSKILWHRSTFSTVVSIKSLPYLDVYNIIYNFSIYLYANMENNRTQCRCKKNNPPYNVEILSDQNLEMDNKR